MAKAEETQWHLRQPNPKNPVVFFGGYTGMTVLQCRCRSWRRCKRSCKCQQVGFVWSHHKLVDVLNDDACMCRRDAGRPAGRPHQNGAVCRRCAKDVRKFPAVLHRRAQVGCVAKRPWSRKVLILGAALMPEGHLDMIQDYLDLHAWAWHCQNGQQPPFRRDTSPLNTIQCQQRAASGVQERGISPRD